MRVNEVLGEERLLVEGFKLTPTEIDHLFGVIADNRYATIPRAIDKSKDIGSSAGKTIGTVASFAKGAASKVANAAKGAFTPSRPDRSGNDTEHKPIESEESERLGEGFFTDYVKNAKRDAKRAAIDFADSRPNVTKDEIIAIWKKDFGATTDSDEIVNMLRTHFKMSYKAVKQAFNKAAKDDPLIMKLATQIHSFGLTDQVIAYLEDPKVYRPSEIDSSTRGYRRPRNREPLNNSLYEDSAPTKLTDNQVRALITHFVSQKKDGGDENETYLNTWDKQFKSASDMATKAKLVTDVTNKMAAAKGAPKWNAEKAKIQGIIKNDSIMKQNQDLVNAVILKLQKGETMNESVENIAKKVSDTKDMIMYGRIKK